MKVLVFPRDPNPYQQELYGAMAASRPIEVRYLEGPTGSQTLNVLLLPFQLVVARAHGFRILHLHWVYPFGLVWATSSRGRRAAEWWYRIFLWSAGVLGFKVAWTAHNIVPHEQVFRDDLSARRALTDRCDTVIAHSEDAASIIREWGGCPVSVVPSGISSTSNADVPTRREARDELGVNQGVVRVLFFGMIRKYKGVDLLLEAVASTGSGSLLDVVIVGECVDPGLRARLEALVAGISVHPVHVQLEFLPDSLLNRHLAAADFAVFPFRAVTNSASVDQALAWGLPVIIPSLPALDDVPDDVAIRYEPSATPTALADALERAASMNDDERTPMVEAALRFASGRTWSDAAVSTWRVLDDLCSAEPHPGPTTPRRQHAEALR